MLTGVAVSFQSAIDREAASDSGTGADLRRRSRTVPLLFQPERLLSVAANFDKENVLLFPVYLSSSLFIVVPHVSRSSLVASARERGRG